MARVRVRFGENEVEVEGPEELIKKHVDQFLTQLSLGYSHAARRGLKDQLLSQPAESAAGKKPPTPAEFYREKGKTDGVSQILVFGKYLEQFRNMSEFTRKDVNAVAKEAKLSKDIHAQFFTNAVKQGLLRKQGQKYSLTLSAEEFLAAH